MATPSTTGGKVDGIETRGAVVRLVAMGFPDSSKSVSSRNSSKLQHVVLEDPILLRLLQAGVLQIGGERLQDFGVADDVATDFFGGARDDVEVAGDDGIARPSLERDQRPDAVPNERQHRRDGENDGKSCGDMTDSHVSCEPGWTDRQGAIVAVCSGCLGRARREHQNDC